MSSAFVSYLDLKDQNKPLPPRAKFVDSYDDAVYHVVKGETLDQFTARIVKSREEKGFPPFDPADLRTYIVTCLAETTDKTENTDKAETSDSSAKKSADKTETSDSADTTKSETKTKTEK